MIEIPAKLVALGAAKVVEAEFEDHSRAQGELIPYDETKRFQLRTELETICQVLVSVYDWEPNTFNAKMNLKEIATWAGVLKLDDGGFYTYPQKGSGRKINPENIKGAAEKWLMKERQGETV